MVGRFIRRGVVLIARQGLSSHTRTVLPACYAGIKDAMERTQDSTRIGACRVDWLVL